MLKMLFLALAVVVFLPPSVPACSKDKVLLCTNTEEHAIALFGAVKLKGNLNLNLLGLVEANLWVDVFGVVDGILTNDDGSIDIYLNVLLVADVDSPLLTVDGVVRVVVTLNGGFINGVCGTIDIRVKIIVDDLNVNVLGLINVDVQQIKVAISAIVEAAIANHREAYKKYICDCFNLHQACIGGK